MDALAFCTRSTVQEEMDGETNACSEKLLADPKQAKPVTSFDAFSVLRWLFVTPGTQPAQMEVAPWQFECATETVSTFCGEYPTMRVRPTSEELLELWQRCTSLHDTAVADAFVRELFGEGGECEWQPRLRALDAMAFFAGHGWTGRRAALAAADDAKDLLQYLVSEVPQCSPEAANMLRILRGEPVQEFPRLGLVRASVKPYEQLVAEASPPAAVVLQPRPQSIAKQVVNAAVVSDQEPETEFGAFQIPEPSAKLALHAKLPVNVPDLIQQPSWQCANNPLDQVLGGTEAAPADALLDPADRSNKEQEGAQVMLGEAPQSTLVSCKSPRSDLGYHWLERSVVEALHFANMEEAFQRLDSDIEHLKRCSDPSLVECTAR